jgi:hypothetical protein
MSTPRKIKGLEINELRRKYVTFRERNFLCKYRLLDVIISMR